TSLNWVVVQPRVAAFTTKVSYDRGGLGWSDPAPASADVEYRLADFATMLDQLRLPTPYILVGHSYGALLVRIFAERFPERVAGLVLIDAVMACEWAHPDAERARLKRKGSQMARIAGWGARLGLVRLVTASSVVKAVMVPKFGGRGDFGTGVVDRLKVELIK